MRTVLLLSFVGIFSTTLGFCGEKKLAKYFAHEVREDKHGVIAPWCDIPNGPCDFRIRIGAETLKRYPWADATRAITPAPEYIYNGYWDIDRNGKIAIKRPPLKTNYGNRYPQWHNGDLGSRYLWTVPAMLRYYAYSGDPMALGIVKIYSDYILDHGLTGKDHRWPKFPISCPTGGQFYGKCDPSGFIGTDLAGEMCRQMLRAGRFLNEPRYLEMAKHWGNLYAEKCDFTPGKPPWPRYANPEAVPWRDEVDGNLQTGGSVYITRFLDELIDMGLVDEEGAIIKARDAGDRYLKDTLLPKWSIGSNWAYYFWDGRARMLNAMIPYFVSEYILENQHRFPQWRYQVQTLLKLTIFQVCPLPTGKTGVYSGAWSYPESSHCCDDSNDYPAQMFAGSYLKYASMAGSETMRELGRRQILLSTYDVFDTGVVIDCLSGRAYVAKSWFKIAHPLAMECALRAMSWLPESLGPNRENHIMRTSSIIEHVQYGDGHVDYKVSDTKGPQVDVLRLTFRPTKISANGIALSSANTNQANGYEMKPLPSGDCLVTVRHDGKRHVKIEGDDPQNWTDDMAMKITGQWEMPTNEKDHQGSVRVASTDGASIEMPFEGNQVRLIGRAATDGGQADVYLDGKKMLAIVDCWAPKTVHRQVLYYRNGLTPGKHVLKIIARGSKNPVAKGTRIYVDGIQWSAAEGPVDYGSGGGCTEPQRVIFGYTGAQEYTDSEGNRWQPALEVNCASPMERTVDAIEKYWWTAPRIASVAGTKDPTLYQYGMHAHDFASHFTVQPGTIYHVRIKLAESRDLPPKKRAMNVLINDELVVSNMDIAAMAGGKNRAVDLVFNGVRPRNGVISVRFSGSQFKDGNGETVQNEAIAQAVAVGLGHGGEGAVPVEISQ